MAQILDEDRYARAKAMRTQLKLSSPPSLQQLCMGFFFKNAGARVTEWKKSGENIFDLMPNSLRTEVLNYLLSSSAGIGTEKDELRKHFYELTYMLINHKTVKLDYQKFNIMSPEVFREILTKVQKCSKLEHLAVQGHDYDEDFIGAEDAMSPRSGIQHLLLLYDLTHLEIVGLWYWKNDGLSKLFSQLKKLVYLEILLHTSVTVSGFQNIHQLKELEEFHFAIDNPDKLSDSECEDSEDCGDFPPPDNHGWIYSYCAENVRSLKLIGATTEACLGSVFTPLGFVAPTITGTSRLEYLHTRCRLPRAHFPNLQHLYFRGPIYTAIDKFYLKFSSFTLLTELNLAALTFDVVAKMLEFVGKQLNVLYIDKNDGSIDFFQILHFCPNLEKFHQDNPRLFDGTAHVAVRPSKYQALVTKHNVRLLKVFRAMFDGLELDYLFELILFAPLLEDLMLIQLTLSKLDCLSLHDVLEGHFRNLRSVLLFELDLGPSCSMDDFGLMVQCLVCSAPCLGQFEFSFKDQPEDDLSRPSALAAKWISEQTVAQTFKQLVREFGTTYSGNVLNL